MTPRSRPAQVRCLAALRDHNQRRTGLIGNLGKTHPLGPRQSSALMIELSARLDATPLRDKLVQQLRGQRSKLTLHGLCSVSIVGIRR
jgi:hypothetical protein